MQQTAITSLYESHELVMCFKNYFPDNWEDIRQDIFVKVLQMPDSDKIENLKHYIIKAIVNLKRQKYGSEKRKYQTFDILPELTHHDEDYSEDHYQQQMQAVNGLPWYHNGILELYVKLGTVKAVSEATKIPYYSVKRTIKQARKLCNK